MQEPKYITIISKGKKIILGIDSILYVLMQGIYQGIQGLSGVGDGNTRYYRLHQFK